MPSVTGIGLVKSLQQSIVVIFTTAFSEYAAVNYELNATDYLLKPISQKRFNQAVFKAVEYWDYLSKREQKEEKYIYVPTDFSLMKNAIADILYIEGLADYLKIHLVDRKKIIARMPMKDMMEKLKPSGFVRVHRSFILPFNKIEVVGGNSIIIGDKAFPIRRTYIEDFFMKYSS